MSDLERLKSVLDEFGIDYTVGTLTGPNGDQCLTITAKTGQTKGYTGNTADWGFDSAGNFEDLGIWSD